jgi:hypothetical protein
MKKSRDRYIGRLNGIYEDGLDKLKVCTYTDRSIEKGLLPYFFATARMTQCLFICTDDFTENCTEQF